MSTDPMTSPSTERTLALHAAPKRAETAGQTGTGLPEGDTPDTPTEAAEQFEEVLVRQFVKVMTKGMFSKSLSGEGGGGWMQSQRDRQRSMMTDMIADRLSDGDSLQIAETLTERWGVSNRPTGQMRSKGGTTPALEQTVDPLPRTSTPQSQNSTDPISSHEGRHLDRSA